MYGERGIGERSAEAAPDELVRTLRLVTRTVQDFLAARAKEARLSTTDFIVLIRAGDGDGVTGAQIARAFGMRSSSVSGLADRLEAKGLIVRRPHPTDGRTILLHATDRGQRAVASALGPLLESLTALAGDFDAAERVAVAAFLDGVGAALSDGLISGQ